MDTMMSMDRGTMNTMGAGMGMNGGSMMPNMMPGMMMPNMMMMPRCTMTMEKMDGGMKVMCRCEDEMAASMMQSMCQMMAGSMCSFVMMMNGMPCCSCNMMMATTTCEMMEMGVMMTCMSGDAKMASMVQCCCDCMSCMMDSGCMCCMMMGNMPICCGTK